ERAGCDLRIVEVLRLPTPFAEHEKLDADLRTGPRGDHPERQRRARTVERDADRDHARVALAGNELDGEKPEPSFAVRVDDGAELGREHVAVIREPGAQRGRVRRGELRRL